MAINKKKRLWLQIASYFIKKEDLERLKKSYNKDSFMRELPTTRSMYTVFDREYYWSPAFSFFNKPYYHGGEWISIHNKNTNKLITKVYRTTEHLNWEEEFDCSKISAIRFYKPSQFIKEGLNMNFSSKEGELVDSSGKIVCLDPSVHNESISGLLIKKQQLLQLLEQEGLALVWSVVGEKQFLADRWEGKDYPNRLNISGLYALDGDLIKGKLTFEEE